MACTVRLSLMVSIRVQRPTVCALKDRNVQLLFCLNFGIHHQSPNVSKGPWCPPKPSLRGPHRLSILEGSGCGSKNLPLSTTRNHSSIPGSIMLDMHVGRKHARNKCGLRLERKAFRYATVSSEYTWFTLRPTLSSLADRGKPPWKAHLSKQLIQLILCCYSIVVASKASCSGGVMANVHPCNPCQLFEGWRRSPPKLAQDGRQWDAFSGMMPSNAKHWKLESIRKLKSCGDKSSRVRIPKFLWFSPLAEHKQSWLEHDRTLNTVPVIRSGLASISTKAIPVALSSLFLSVSPQSSTSWRSMKYTCVSGRGRASRIPEQKNNIKSVAYNLSFVATRCIHKWS